MVKEPIEITNNRIKILDYENGWYRIEDLEMEEGIDLHDEDLAIIPQVKALIEALEQSQKMLRIWSAHLNVSDPLANWGDVIETQKQNKKALAPFQKSTRDK